jgi:outer membrane protein insertion porin family
MLRQFKPLRALALPAVVLLAPLSLRAQDVAIEGNPRIERLTFAGAEGVAERDLREVIVTQETRCRGLLLRPFCALTDWRVLHERHYLDPEELRADVLRLRIHYFQRGYRQAAVSSRVQPRGRGVEVVFDIDEGRPTIIASMSVEQTRDVLSRRQIRRAALPEQGEPLDLLRLSAGIVRLDDRMGRAGHLDGEVHDTATFDDGQLSAHLRVVIDPGPRTVLRELDIQGNDDVSDRTISDALMLRRGRVLRNTDIAGSQRSLYESNLFHEARVVVPEQADSAKRVEIEVREAPPRSARVGAGFNTIEFIQTEARFTHFNWHGRGRRLDVRATVGNLLAGQLNGRAFFRDMLPEGADASGNPFMRPTWLASAELMQPAFRSANNAVGISVFTHRRILPAVAIDEGIGGEVSFTRRFDYRTPASLTYRHELVSVEAGDLYFCVNYGICELSTVAALQQRHTLSPAGLSFFSDQANHPLAPTAGYRLRLDAEHASGATLSDFRYNRVSATGSLYHSLDVHRRRVLAGRLRAGWVAPMGGTAEALGIELETDDMLHPRKRFYAGGARSVRGFRENQLGPRVLTIDPGILIEEGGCTQEQVVDGTCDPAAVPDDEFQPRPAGGRTVIEASVEYRFPLTRVLQGAVFLDGARVGASVGGVASGARTAITPGFGARYDSPIGPIRVDLGVRPGGAEDLPVLTEVMGPDGERRLVRLDAIRRYDPLGGNDSFLRKTLGRLTLHLAIGEAF